MPNLFIDIEARFAKFQDSLDQVQRQSERNIKGIERSFATLGRSIAAVAGAGGIFALGKSLIDAADELNTVSERSGIAVEDLAGLQFAAQQTGTDFETMAKGVNKLSVAMSEIAGGGKKDLAGIFQGLGLDDLAKGAANGQQALLRLAEVFPRLSEIDQARLAAEAFGERIGSQLVPALAQGRGALEEMIAEGKRLNPVTTEMAKAADEFNDTIAKISLSIRGSLLPAVTAMLVPLQELADEFLEGQKAAGGFWNALKLGINISPFDSLEDSLAKLRQQRDALTEKIATTEKFSWLLPAVPASVLEQQKDDIEAAIRFQESMLARRERAALNAAGIEPVLGGAAAGGLKLPGVPGKPAKKQKVAPLNDPFRVTTEISPEALRAEEGFKRAQERAEALARALESGPNAQLEKQRTLMQDLAAEFGRGNISAEQFSDAAAGALGLVAAEAEKSKSLVEELGLTFTSAFENAIVAGEGLSDVLQGLEQDILRIVTRSLLTEPIGKAITGAVGGAGGIGGIFDKIFGDIAVSILGAKSGAAFGPGGLYAFAGGGVVDSPTTFRFGRGGQFAGLMGEAGPEAIMPLKRGRDGRLGIAGGMSVTNHFSVSGPVTRESENQIARAVGVGIRRAMARNG